MINKQTLHTWDLHVYNPHQWQLDIDLTNLTPDEIQFLSVKVLEYHQLHPDFKALNVVIDAKQSDVSTWRDFWLVVQHLNLDIIHLFSHDDGKTKCLTDKQLTLLANQLADITYTPTSLSGCAANPKKNPDKAIIRTFEKDVFAKVQTLNQAKFSGEPTEAILPPLPPVHQQASVADKQDYIKLKDLIGCLPEHAHDYDHLINIEVQQLEVEEERRQVEAVGIAVTETTIATNDTVKSESCYQGELIDFEKFSKPPYRELVLASVSSGDLYFYYQQEWFSNFPNAIKYLTPAAALYVAQHAGNFATVNEEDLSWALFKKTPLGELVLDYDPNAPISRKLFEPVPFEQDQTGKLFEEAFESDIPPSTLLLIKTFEVEDYQSHLKNLWIKYGDKGVEALLTTLSGCDETHPNLSCFLLDNHFKKFPHWDVFLNRRFLAMLHKLKLYDAEKLRCLKTFLERTDRVTQFDLVNIVHDFDQFWDKWCDLAKKNQLSPSVLNGKWEHKRVGDPVVYMKRLETILNNARDVREQLIAFSGIKGIRLYHLADQEDYFDHSVFSSSSLINAKKAFETGLSVDDAYRIVHQNGHYYLLIVSDNKRSYADEFWIHTKGYVELDANLVKQANLPLPSPADLEKLSDQPVTEHEADIEHYPALIEYIQQIQKPYLRPKLSSLRKYGDCYASKQGYTVVDSDKMLLFPSVDSGVFNPNAPVYRQKFPTFYRAGHPEGISLMVQRELYRFIGQQSHGISLHRFHSGLRQIDGRLGGYNGNQLGYICAYLMSNEQYDGTGLFEFAKGFLEFNYLTDDDHEIIDLLMQHFLKLLEKGFFIQVQDALAICKVCAILKYKEDSSIHINRDKAIERLFQALQDNFEATMKGVRLLPVDDHYRQHPYQDIFFIYALDTADFLIQNSPEVAKGYPQDLFLLSTLINLDPKEAYYQEKEEDLEHHLKWELEWQHKNGPENVEKTLKAQQVLAQTKESLNKIKALLSQAASQPRPNNLDFAIQAIVQAKQPLSKHDLLELLTKVQSLTDYDPKAVEAILTQHQVSVSIQVPDFKNVSMVSMKYAMMELLEALDRATYEKLADKFEQMDIADLKEVIAKQPLYYFGSGQILQEFKKRLLQAVTEQLPPSVLRDYLEQQYQNSVWASQTLSFEVIEQIINQASHLVSISKPTLERESFKQHPDQYLELFKKGHLSSYPFETLALFWTMLAEMQSRDEGPILDAFFAAEKRATDEARVDCINFIRELNQQGFPTSWLVRLIQLEHETKQNQAQALAFKQLKANLLVTAPPVPTSRDLTAGSIDLEIPLDPAVDPVVKPQEREDGYIEKPEQLHLLNDNLNFKDPILGWLMAQPNLSVEQLLKMQQLTAVIPTRRQGLSQLMAHVLAANQFDAWLQALEKAPKPEVLLDIISGCRERSETILASFDYLQLVNQLNKLSSDELNKLHVFVEKHQVNLSCLNYYLPKWTERSPNIAPQPVSSAASSPASSPVSSQVSSPAPSSRGLTAGSTVLETSLDLAANPANKSWGREDGAGEEAGEKVLPLPPNLNFETFLADFEKNPFGAERDFSTDEVERVVNHFIDLNQHQAYPYAYRRQLTEAFLFVNRAGQDLPVYLGRPAQALTDDEIQSLFLGLKRGEVGAHLTPFMRHLYALGLMREAMFRKTGQFPYSTQMLALIDCLMHEGDVISKIPTGQGKSLVDVMKGCLLWLNSDRVDITTASIIDAKRDLKIYHPFLALLGVPHKDKALQSTPESSIADIQQDGVNFTTLGDIGMITAKINTDPNTPPGWDDLKLSLVMNESDYQTLDDLTIYRLASVGQDLVAERDIWIYTIINQFVQDPEFHRPKSQDQDLDLLRNRLTQAAIKRGRTPAFINQYTDKQLLKWIDAGIMKHYRLVENKDYLLTTKFEPKLIYGQMQLTREAKLLRKDGNINQTAQYGGGLHQLIYDDENQCLGHVEFVVAPESKTFFALNNKNIIDYYRSKKGLIGGSSATPGSNKETDLQHEKYGFEFSQVEPHQTNQVKAHAPIILPDQDKQFETIIQQLLSTRRPDQKEPPTLIFFADIPTANQFYQQLRKRCAEDKIQCPSPLGDVMLAVRNAADLGMMTVVTGLFGRNTNIPYDYSIGLDLIETCVTLTERERDQRRGRTGRQWSKGEIYEIYNRQDFKGQTVEQIQTKLEDQAERQRQFNEQFYDILAVLHQQLNKPPPSFYKEKWSVMIETLEDLYRTQKRQGSFALDDFLDECLVCFSALPVDKKVITRAQIKDKLNQKYLAREKKAVYDKPVKLSDCVPAALIAYHFIEKLGPANPNITVDAAVVSDKLQKLLEGYQQSTFPQLNNDYLAYLSANADNIHVIRQIHQNHLHQYLKSNISKPLSMTETIKRWLGYESTLMRLINDQGYLLLFKALVHLDSPTVSVEQTEPADSAMTDNLKHTLTSMLDEYVQYSWFVNDARKKAVTSLKADLAQAKTPQELFTALTNSVIEMTQKDIELNQKRWIPLHLLGRSRYQQLLTQLIQLILVFSDDPLVETHLHNLLKAIKLSKKTGDLPSIDELLMDLKSVKTTDRFNLSVIQQSLEKLLTWRQNISFFKGMSERQQPCDVSNIHKKFM